MENFHFQASKSADREPNLAPLLPLTVEQNLGNFAFHSLVILPVYADQVSMDSARHFLLARRLVGQSGY